MDTVDRATPPHPPGSAATADAAGLRPTGEADFESTELRDFSRTVAEIEWLLVILVLLYHIFQDRSEDNTAAIYAGLTAFSVIIIAFHYLNFIRRPTRWTLTVETWIMIVFITWVLYHTGRLDSPLLNMYLLPIITSALTLGQMVTLLQVGLIAACYIFLGYVTDAGFLSIITAGNLAAALAPMLLVAYITTMLSQDILNAMARIRLISETDALTGAYNMRAFNAIIERECALAARYNRFFSLLMIDSDNLKHVNDTHGHDAGDRLIKLIFASIRRGLRTTDVVARYGGDEFVCLLPETGAGAAVEAAERIRGRVAATPLDTGDDAVSTSVSIGIAAYPEHGASFESVAKSADRALYAAKTQGRNRVAVFSADA